MMIPTQLGATGYGADEIVGKSLVAKKAVNVKRLPTDAAPVDYTVNAGETIGVVYSWLGVANGRSNLYWMFYDANHRPFYVAHESNAFNLTSLQDQGAISTKDKTAAALDAANLENKGPFIYYLEKYGKILLITGCALYITKLVADTYSSTKKQTA